MSDVRDDLRARIADRCESIERMFTEPVKVTVLVRNPAHPDGSCDVQVTNERAEDLERVVDALRRVATTGVLTQPGAEK